MARPLRVLIAEDSENDVLLIVKELQRGGFDPVFERVDSATAMTNALGRTHWDIILADYVMPGFTALDALSVLRMSGLDLPFIVVSGSIGEEIAVEAMRSGAHDYVMKNNMTRLATTVERELQQAEGRRLKYKAEMALKETNQTLWALIKSSPLAIVAVDLQRNVTVWNPAAERLFGWRENEVLGTTLPIVPKDKHPEFREIMAQAMEGKPTTVYETHRKRKDGGLVDVSMTVAALLDSGGKAIGAMAIFTDITERKRAEETRTRLTAILEATTDMVGIADTKGKIVYVNRAGRTWFGKFLKEDVTNTFIADYYPRWAYEKIMKEGIPTAIKKGTWSGESVLLGRDGREIPVSQVIIAHKGDSGNVEFLSTIARNPSDLKRAEKTLWESEERFRQIAETIEEVFWLTNPVKNEIIYISPGYENIWGRSCANLYQNPMSWVEAIHPEDRQRVLEAVTTKQANGMYDEEYRIVRPDGSIRWIQDRAYPIRNDRGEVYRIAGIAEDITEEKQLSDQFRQVQKMEAVGQLAGGIAHDFNNLLTAIGGYTDFVLEQMEPGSRLEADVEEIKKATERAASLTRQLLAFSRQQVMQPVVLNLDELVAGMEGMLRRLIGENIELVTAGAPDLASVKADPHQFEQVIMNLVLNARDAMPQGGRLTIETTNVELDKAFVQLHVGARPGAYVMLAVSDTGTGMDAEIQKHLFEPFFTTKEKGKGTGLGLSTVYGIVKQSGGYVSVYSEPNRGSCFKIYLPQVSQPVPERPVRPVPAKMAGGTETILLVEDEEAVRGLAAKILRAKGYAVLEAGDGKEAQAVLKTHRGDLDLLLTDVVMPQMGGPELAKWLRSVRRGIRVLFMTGYTDHSAFRDGSLPPGTGLIQKPFSPQALAQKVREILDSSKSAPFPSDKTEKQKKPATK